MVVIRYGDTTYDDTVQLRLDLETTSNEWVLTLSKIIREFKKLGISAMK